MALSELRLVIVNPSIIILTIYFMFILIKIYNLPKYTKYIISSVLTLFGIGMAATTLLSIITRVTYNITDNYQSIANRVRCALYAFSMMGFVVGAIFLIKKLNSFTENQNFSKNNKRRYRRLSTWILVCAIGMVFLLVGSILNSRNSTFLSIADIIANLVMADLGIFVYWISLCFMFVSREGESKLSSSTSTKRKKLGEMADKSII